VAIELVPDTIVIEPEACAPSCGEGTVWDPVNEECIIAIPADLNYDGCVTVNDLLVLLAVHGTCPPYPEWPDTPVDTTWTCGDPLTYWDYAYATVLIGDQCWFAENLRTNQFRNGEEIEYITQESNWHAPNGPGLCALYHDTTNADTYGYLYNGYVVLDERQCCPAGWSPPTDLQVMQLELHVGMAESDTSLFQYRGVGTSAPLMSSPSDTPPWTGNNSSGFSMTDGQRRVYTGQFAEPNHGYFWTRTSGIYRVFKFDEFRIGRFSDDLRTGFSIRCLKD
jgi:uncharacterized protein (TIGR02145 family)